MSHWNHRVVRQRIAGQPDYYAIHEAYYSEGEAKPLITEEPVRVGVSNDDPDETAVSSLRWTLRQMLTALEKPILDYDTREEIQPKE